MDQLNAMRVFVAVVEEQGFSAASRALGIPLPTVCRKVANLEDQLGAQLLIRTTRKVTVSDAGERYYEDVRRILEDVDDAALRASGEYQQAKGLLTITAPSLFARLHILPICTDFMKLHGEIEVRLLFSNHVLDLLEDQIDLGIRIGAQMGSSMNVVQVGTVRQVVCASPTYLAVRGRPSTPSDITRYETITFSRSCKQTPWAFKAPSGKRFEVDVRSRMLLNSAEGAIESATRGFGLTQLYSCEAMDEIASGDLEIVLQGYEIEPTTVSFVFPQGERIPEKLKTFNDFAISALRKRLIDADKMCNRAPS